MDNNETLKHYKAEVCADCEAKLEDPLKLNFRNLRLANNKTQEDIANMLNLTRSGYAYIERGDREASYSTLIKLADYYEVTIDFLLGRNKNGLNI